MSAPRTAPSPADFRRQSGNLTSALWIAGLLLAALGVMFAVVDVSNGHGADGAADSSFGGVPDDATDEPVLHDGTQLAPAPKPAASDAAATDAAARASERAARQRDADVLIDRLVRKLRAEREAREKACKEKRAAQKKRDRN